jgi:chloramphenicol-sensitive protein RarD
LKPDFSEQSPYAPVYGACSAFSAFLIWGLSPLYWHLLSHVSALEVVMHRVIWSFLFLVPVLAAQNSWKDFTQAVRSWRVLLILMVSTLLVSCNWFLFIWAIANEKVLETSLGYYINPLVNVLLGMVFLKERLRFLQWLALIMAGISVSYLTLQHGQLPWISLVLAFTFAGYGLIRKIAPVGPAAGLAVETLLFSIPALAYLVILHVQGAGAFLRLGWRTDWLLVGTALMTALPLLLFTSGARRIQLSTLGFLQYTAPTCSFLLGVFVFHEPLPGGRIWAFVLIWAALAVYSVDSTLNYRRLSLDKQAATKARSR